MIAIIDSRAPKEAIEELKLIADKVLTFSSENITYESISGHPDIFIYQDSENVILAPNSPKILTDFLYKNEISFSTGNSKIGDKLNDSALYNCISTKKYFFHKKGFTDSKVLEINSKKKFINLPQAYSACSLIALNENYFLTSDKGILKTIKSAGLNCEYFSPEKILIPIHNHGFIGGTSGIFQNKIYFIGNIKKHSDYNIITDLTEKSELEIVSLYDGNLYDGGKIFFFK
jgi:hypothetical protein